MWNRLVDPGQAGEQIPAAWIAKEELRALLALARTTTSRHQISHRLWTFYRWCADTDIPELHRLAATIQAWWPQIEAFILTGITNAASEGVNRLIKLEARNAFGFPQPHQPTTTVTLRKHPGGLATRQARLTSKTRQTRQTLPRHPRHAHQGPPLAPHMSMS